MDPSINLDVGSSASIQVVEPIVARLTPDPIDANIELFILTRLRQEFPEMFAEEGGAMSDMLVKPARVLLEPFRREIRSVRMQLSLSDPNQLANDEADKLMSNFFFERNAGGYAKVRVRIFYQNAVSQTVGSSNIAFTGTGLRFFPTHAQAITSEGMLFNVDTSGLYYFDVSYQAERPGAAYNVAKNAIIGVTGISAATRVTNLAKAVPGNSTESTSDFIARCETSMGEKSNNTLNGLIAVLRENFSSLRVLQAIGFNDAEMHRDVIVGGSYGPILFSDTKGNTVADGAAPVGYTPYLDFGGTISFTTAFGPVGTDISGYAITVWYDDGTGMAPHTWQLGEVISAIRITVHSSYTRLELPSDAIVQELWSIRKRDVITLSDMPGGLLFPDNLTYETVDVPSNEIHVGGCVDVYVRGGEITDAVLPLTLISDDDVIARREDAQTTAADDEVILNDLTAAEWALVVEGSTTLYLEEGGDAGPYRVIEKVAGGPPYAVRLASAMTAPGVVTDISYLLVDDIDIDLVSPREMRYSGSDLQTVAGLATIQTVSGLPSFTGVGVVDTDLVRILSGDDEGEYGISAGGVAAGSIILASGMTTTASPLAYEIYRKEDGIKRPLLRVKTVELLDSNLDPTGAFVPYRHPIDVRSNSFQNPGNAPKAGTEVSVTSDSYLSSIAGSATLTAVDSAGGAVVEIGGQLSWYALGVRTGDIINLDSSDNQGYYTIVEVGGNPLALIATDLQLIVDATMETTETAIAYTLGPPSYGSFRLYFLDPLTFEATYASTQISVEVGLTTRVFRPDSGVWCEYLPSDTRTAVASMTSGGASAFIVPYDLGGAPNLDMMTYGIAVDDRVEITYAPLVGSIDIAVAGPLNLDGLSVLIDVGSGNETVTFSGTALDAGTIVSQLNSGLSKAVAFDYSPSGFPAEHYIGLRGDHQIIIRNNAVAGDATATIFGQKDTHNPWLPAAGFAGADVDNDSPEKGFYLVNSCAAFPTGGIELLMMNGGLWAADNPPTWTGNVVAELGHYFHISRPGLQRMSSTEMLDQGVDEHGFYYFDVECISQGHGNAWNIVGEVQGVITGYDSEGWDITTDDDDTSYSTVEECTLHITPRVLIAGVEDDPEEKEELTGRSIQIAYEHDPITEQIQTFLLEPQYRILVSSPLVRSLLPVFVRTHIEYRGGGTESSVRSELAAEIESILPSAMLEVDTLVGLIRATGSTKITHPVTLVGISHQRDRTITTERSVDQISNARLSALIPDDADTPEGASHIQLTRTS